MPHELPRGGVVPPNYIVQWNNSWCPLLLEDLLSVPLWQTAFFFVWLKIWILPNCHNLWDLVILTMMCLLGDFSTLVHWSVSRSSSCLGQLRAMGQDNLTKVLCSGIEMNAMLLGSKLLIHTIFLPPSTPSSSFSSSTSAFHTAHGLEGLTDDWQVKRLH